MAMLPDPISLAESIAAFVGTVNDLSGTLAEVGANKRSFRNLNETIMREASDIARFCRALTSCGLPELKGSLDELRSDLDHFRVQLEQSLPRRSGTVFSPAIFAAKAWLRRKDVEAQISYLQRRITSCRLRFAVSASARSEYNTIVCYQENRHRLEQMEKLVSKILVDTNGCSGHSFPVFMTTEPEDIDYQFLRRQVRRVVDAIKGQRAFQTGITEAPNEADSWTVGTFGPASNGAWFSQSLVCTLESIRELTQPRSGQLSQHTALSILSLVVYLVDLAWYTEAVYLADWITDKFQLLYNRNHNIEYARSLAYSLFLSGQGRTRLRDSKASSTSDAAVEAWKRLYDAYGTPIDLQFLIRALGEYTANLYRNGQFEESLDHYRQTLLLLRTSHSAPDPSERRTVTWSASGEADVVFSSSREIVRSVRLAHIEAFCLWNLANSFAATGHYAEARISAADAVNCLKAFLIAIPEAPIDLRHRATGWQTLMTTWVSIPLQPARHFHSYTTISLDEGNDAYPDEDSADRPMFNIGA
ncbi:hypothetical protein HGRIS_014420 [Hohenbuehelia grisea]|uniref:Fungal N-terminal domain-containing protein n=1 Tax=Hohenbuehelia grisea TaxID=104357 RepID=A0ABR3JVI2_9AGAR